MEKQVCPSKHNCQVFTIEGFVETSRKEYYAATFCESGEDGWKECRRFKTRKALNLCPDFVLPDSQLTIDEILDRLENE